MTQELIANMLGVRREGVTEAALNLQRAGLISYARGHIKVLNRKGLEARTCECYAVVKKEYDRLLPKITQKKQTPSKKQEAHKLKSKRILRRNQHVNNINIEREIER